MTHTSLPFTWGKLCKRPEVSNQKQKEQKYKFVELLIPILNKFISYQFLLILLEGANHEQSSQNN